jgi:hypothetical protein
MTNNIKRNNSSITEHFYDISDVIFKIIENYLPNSIKQIKNTKLPFTLKALINLHINGNFIKNGILDLINSDNLYGAKILYRSLIEHFLKSEYIFMKVAIDGNDTVGYDYFNFYDFDECQKYANSCKHSAKLYGIDVEESLDFDILRKQLPETKNFSKNEIKEKISQFNYRKIISFIINCLDNNKFNGNTFLIGIIPIFSQLSSFVHGGPFARKEMIKCADPKERDETYINILEMTLLLSSNIVLRYFIVLSNTCSEYQNAVKEIETVLKNIKGKTP